MDNDDARLTPYFNSYSQLPPNRIKHLQEEKPSFEEWLSEAHPKNSLPIFNPLNEVAHPILYQAVMDECDYRQIDIPSCHILTNAPQRTPLAMAFSGSHAIMIQDIVIPKLTKKEMRALVAHEIKHLYQAEPLTRAQYHANEYDADRASADSTDYESVRSMMFKLRRLDIERGKDEFPRTTAVILKVMDLNPNFFIEHFALPAAMWNKISPRHPTTANRLKQIRPIGNVPS